MAEVRGAAIPSGLIPDDLTIPQFFLDETHPLRPVSRAGAPWFIDGTTGREVLLPEVREKTSALGIGMRSRWGISADDVVCVHSPNHIDWPIVAWAVLRLGAVLAPANPEQSVEELVYQLELVKATLVFTHSTCLTTAVEAARLVGLTEDRIVIIDTPPPSVSVAYASLDGLMNSGRIGSTSFIEQRLRPGEAKTKVAFLCFSSGTTGKPKAVAISHYAAIANVLQVRLAVGVPPRYLPGDAFLGVLPFFHVFGLLSIHLFVWMASTVVVMPSFNFQGFLENIQRYRIKHLFVVPPMIVLLCKHPLTKKYDLSSVRWLTCGAAPLSSELTQQLAAILPRCAIGQGYGLTETFVSVSLTPNDAKAATPGASGVLVPGVVARVVKLDGTLAKRGEAGELIVTGPSMALYYHQNAQATQETFVNGWVRTGDEVVVNERNELLIVDRIKELIKVKGFQVAPAELEGHLLDHPDVADACVVGVAHEYRGEAPVAFVVLSTSAQEKLKQNPQCASETKARLMKHIADGKAEYKRLTGGVEFVDAIPKSPNGKMLRRILRDRARTMRMSDPGTQHTLLSRL